MLPGQSLPINAYWSPQEIEHLHGYKRHGNAVLIGNVNVIHLAAPACVPPPQVYMIYYGDVSTADMDYLNNLVSHISGLR